VKRVSKSVKDSEEPRPYMRLTVKAVVTKKKKGDKETAEIVADVGLDELRRLEQAYDKLTITGWGRYGTSRAEGSKVANRATHEEHQAILDFIGKSGKFPKSSKQTV
jgi:hypothetical protein